MDQSILRFHKDGTFRALMISDFHAGADCNPKLMAGIDALLEHTKPDVVLVGGDQCLNKQTAEEVDAYMRRIMEPILRRGLPWCHVWGNHDREVGIDVETEQRIYEALPYCLSQAGPKDVSGVGNYCLPILASASDDVKYHIWALDSFSEVRDYVRLFHLPKDTRFILPHPFGDGRVNSSPMFDQVMWYYNESVRREQEAGHKIPAIMYMHIPIIEFCLIARNPEECNAFGSKRESVCGSELNSGLFMACLQRGDVKGIFAGHEHYNDFQGEYCGITLAYDNCVGYNMSAHDDLRGGRVIDLTEDGGMRTRMVHLIDIMGQDAIRDIRNVEGHCNYFFRIRES